MESQEVVEEQQIFHPRNQPASMSDAWNMLTAILAEN
jgi:hypothetical protein